MTRVAHCVSGYVGPDGMQRCERCGVALLDARNGPQPTRLLPAGRVLQPVADACVREKAIRERSGIVPCAILN